MVRQTAETSPPGRIQEAHGVGQEERRVGRDASLTGVRPRISATKADAIASVPSTAKAISVYGAS